MVIAVADAPSLLLTFATGHVSFLSRCCRFRLNVQLEQLLDGLGPSV